MNADDFYQLVVNRRDVRGEYLAEPVAPEVLARILNAAHHAPSVGYSQPWNFILVRDRSLREKVHRDFLSCRETESSRFDGDRQALYNRLRLEGILTAPENLLVTCDRSRGGAVVLGRTQQPDTDIYSTVCAVQNLWLAARAEGLGMGWVSILQTDTLKRLFNLPDAVLPIAYLCLGYVSGFHDKPELEKRGWRQRLPLEDLVYTDHWGNAESGEPLMAAVRNLERGDKKR